MTTPAAAALLPATPPTADLRLPVAPGQPGFAATFGQQVTLIVRDGVQTARLHLNPAELGPITVQIALEGGKAQVHLAVEHALTRQALEQAMPVLAGSLRESGLTLTGGGVFEQPQPGAGGLAGQAGDGAARDAQARADAGRGDTRRTGERLLDDAGANRPVSMRLRGMVDLVA
jgi:flagellar hook-length control protein FliK